jgi:hypothetical protein
MSNESTKKPESVTIVPRVVVTPETPAYYANFVEVANSQYDFSLSVARIGSPLSEAQIERIKNGEPLLVDAILQIVLPPTVAEGLIRALTEQLQKYRDMIAKQGGHNV